VWRALPLALQQMLRHVATVPLPALQDPPISPQPVPSRRTGFVLRVRHVLLAHGELLPALCLQTLDVPPV
jgi:hypothetical protein